MLDNQDYEMNYGTWNVDGKSVSVASTYRVAWRRMAATTGFRTFYPALNSTRGKARRWCILSRSDANKEKHLICY